MRSMTGYGRGAAERDGTHATVEIRAVNHRFLDLKLRGASLDPTLEEQLTQRVRALASRGAVTVSVRLEHRGPAAAMTVDVAAAKALWAELVELRKNLEIPEDAPDGQLSVAVLCAQPGVLVPRQEEAAGDAVAACVLAAADDALAALIQMREAEGARLQRDLDARIGAVAGLVERVAERVAEAPAEAQRRLTERLDRLLGLRGVDIDEARLAQEVAILADRLDVTEELVRLRSHLSQVTEIALADTAPDGPVGRRLDFLVQELGRELNTIASKSQSAEIAQIIVEAKAELEKIREQVQNIE